MKIVFMGTPDFAVAALERLIADGHEVTGVFTQEDKPKGRHMTLTPPPVKVYAMEHGIPVVQLKTLKNGAAIPYLQEFAPDLIVVAAYGMLLRKDVLEFPKYGCINVHASLLPKYRGAAPINHCILDGCTETGVTTMQMDEGLDTGDMLVSKSIPIGEDETAGELFDRLAVLGGDVLSETLVLLEQGKLNPVKQNDADMTYAGMLSKADSPIDWNRPAGDIHNQVRGLSPWPTASTELDGKSFKIHATRKADKPAEAPAGAVPGQLTAAKDRLFVCCGDGAYLELLEVQPLGSRRMTAADYLRGHRPEAGTCFSF